MAQTPHNQKSSHHLGSSPSTGPRAATSLSSGAVGGTQPATRAAMLAPPGLAPGRGPHKARSVGSLGQTEPGEEGGASDTFPESMTLL